MIDGATPMRASVSANVLRGPGHDDVAGPDQAHTAGADVPVDRADDRQRALDDGRAAGGSSRGRARRPGRPGSRSPAASREVGARAERAAGVAEDHHPHRRVGRGASRGPDAAASPAPWTARCGCAASPASAARRPAPSTRVVD